MIASPIEPKINDTNNGILTIWGIDFDATGKSLHLPNFKQSWIRFDMACLFTILTIDDACQCQTEDSKPKCKDVSTDNVNLYVKNGTVRFQVDLNRLEPHYMEEDHRHSSKFSKRNYIFPLHSQKLVTYFGQISPDFAFLFIKGCANRRDWSK